MPSGEMGFDNLVQEVLQLLGTAGMTRVAASSTLMFRQRETTKVPQRLLFPTRSASLGSRGDPKTAPNGTVLSERTF